MGVLAQTGNGRLVSAHPIIPWRLTRAPGPRCEQHAEVPTLFLAYDTGDQLFKGSLAKKPYTVHGGNDPQSLGDSSYDPQLLGKLCPLPSTRPRAGSHGLGWFMFSLCQKRMSGQDVTMAFVVVTKASYMGLRRRNGQCCCLRIQWEQRHLIHCQIQ
jgi:hypothetical protein